MTKEGPDRDRWRDELDAPPPGTELGPLSELADGESLEYRFGRRGRFSMFVVRRGDDLRAYLNVCPHFGSRLNQGTDSFLTDDGEHIRCTLHQSAFRIEDGYGFLGEAKGCWLDPVPVAVRDGTMVLGEAGVAGGS